MSKIKKEYIAPQLKQIGKVVLITQTNDIGNPNDGGAPGPHRIS